MLRIAMKTGRVLIGSKEAIKRNNDVKLVIMASNCPEHIKREINENIKVVLVFEYAGSGVDLGYVCGKPYLISVLSVIDPGDSEILSIKKNEG
jgi:large subunit ribosomal protein L30e